MGVVKAQQGFPATWAQLRDRARTTDTVKREGQCWGAPGNKKIKVGLQNDFKRHTLLVKQSTQYISSIFSLLLLWTYFWSLFLNSLSRNSLRIRYYDVDIRPQLSPGKQISANKTKRDASKADIHRTTNPIWVCRAKCFFYTPDMPWWSGDTAGT